MTLAFLYEKSGDLTKAKHVYEKVLARQPRQWAAANNLAFLLADHPDTDKDLDRALELALQAERMRPGEATVLDTLGWIHFKKGDNEKALPVFEKALEISPDSGVINYHAARVLVVSERSAEAREKLEKALAVDADFSERDDAKALLEKIGNGE